MKCTKKDCRNQARYYGPIGGYGKLCNKHTDEKNVKQRAASAKRRKLSGRLA